MIANSVKLSCLVHVLRCGPVYKPSHPDGGKRARALVYRVACSLQPAGPNRMDLWTLPTAHMGRKEAKSASAIILAFSVSTDSGCDCALDTERRHFQRNAFRSLSMEAILFYVGMSQFADCTCIRVMSAARAVLPNRPKVRSAGSTLSLLDGQGAPRPPWHAMHSRTSCGVAERSVGTWRTACRCHGPVSLTNTWCADSFPLKSKSASRGALWRFLGPAFLFAPLRYYLTRSSRRSLRLELQCGSCGYCRRPMI
jgi:hypothetical protein